MEQPVKKWWQLASITTFCATSFLLATFFNPLADTQMHTLPSLMASTTTSTSGMRIPVPLRRNTNAMLTTASFTHKTDSLEERHVYEDHSTPLVLTGMAALAAAFVGVSRWLGLKAQPGLRMQEVPLSALPTMSRRNLLSASAAAALLLSPIEPARAEGYSAQPYPQRLDPVIAQQRYDEARLEEENRRIQAINRVPGGFPTFIRDGYNVKIKVSDSYETLPSGLVVFDFIPGNLDSPKPQEGQKVIFHYTAYNENGARIDSSYNGGRPLEQVVGIGGMVPGFEEGIKGMHIGGQRRIIVPPELGPPVGPSTFFSAKQFEVFDVELLDILDCRREGFSIASRLVCSKTPA